jgi:uncharacterized membrane protein
MTETSAGKATLHYKLHWHILFTHFPVSFFLGSFGFILLHLITGTSCFELAGFVSLIVGAAFVVPTTVSGWTTWKGRYKGFKSKLFLNKIRISFAMVGISFAMVIFRSIYIIDSLDLAHNIWHVIYFIGITLLMIGSIAEGYYGGRLNHR